MKFYAACLASYNNGVLHGAWIEASTDTDEMQEEINAMLRRSKFPNVKVECPTCDGDGADYSSNETCPRCKGTGQVPSAEEWAIHDTDGLPNSGEYMTLDEIAEIMELYEDGGISVDDDEITAVVKDCCGDLARARELLVDNYCGTYSSFRDYAEEVADEMLSARNIKDTDLLSNYFDYDSYARDLKYDMHTVDVPSGVMVFHSY